VVCAGRACSRLGAKVESAWQVCQVARMRRQPPVSVWNGQDRCNVGTAERQQECGSMRLREAVLKVKS